MTIRGEEQTLVPNVIGLDLANAMIELQQKSLSARVQLRVSPNPGDKGTVLAQDPSPGTLAKAQRKIALRVSKGPVIDEVENYINMRLDEVELQLQSMSTIYGAILKIKKPVTEIYSDSPAGTILQQNPEPGTKITTLTELELIVSRGPRGAMVTIPDYVGLPIYVALRELASHSGPFVFSGRDAEGEEEPGTVVSQSPQAETDVQEGTLIQLIITTPVPEEPEEAENGQEAPEPVEKIFGIVQRTLPDYPTPIELTIEVISPFGDRAILARVRHPGGIISVPYWEPENSQIIVSSTVRELFRHLVRAPQS